MAGFLDALAFALLIGAQFLGLFLRAKTNRTHRAPAGAGKARVQSIWLFGE